MFDFHFDWAENFAVHIESIDTHHKQYFKIARDIEQQLQKKCIGITDKQILDIVCDLREYTGYHFYEEERLMKETHYPKLAEHQKKHSEFQLKISKLDIPKMRQNPEKELKLLLEFLLDNFYNHIMKDDRVMADFVRANLQEDMKQSKQKVKAEDPFEAKYGPKIAELDVTRAYLYRNQTQKGRVILLFKDKKNSLSSITVLERNMFYSDVSRVVKGLKAFYNPDAFNYASYEDIEERIHFHIVPKFNTEVEWTEPFQVEVEPVTENSEGILELATELRKLIL